MNIQPPTSEQIREILIKAPRFDWPEFSQMPLNCFDLTAALLTFPGDLTEFRNSQLSDCVEYKIDINDLTTCPRIDRQLNIERWNEHSLAVRWILGRLRWACSVNANDFFSLNQGFFNVHMNIMRLQNIEGISNLTHSSQLKQALHAWLKPQVESGFIKEFSQDSIFEKESSGISWTVARSFDSCNFPVYEIAHPIDHRTIISVNAHLDSCWFRGETIPEAVEQKHLASLWDFLSHVQLHPAGENNMIVGSVSRETPGKAEKMNDDFEW